MEDEHDGEPGECQACTGLGMGSEGAVMIAVGERDDGNGRKVPTMSSGAGVRASLWPGRAWPGKTHSRPPPSRHRDRAQELAVREAPKGGNGYQLWQPLRANPEYRADWRAHGGAAVQVEPAPFPLRVQSEVDLKAARWGLLAWEDPRVRNRSSPFWADVPMLRARSVGSGEGDAPALRDLVRESAAALTGLRLRDGAVVLKAERRRRVEQVRVVNSDAFDPNRDGLMLVTDLGLKPLSDWDRQTNFAWIIGSRKR